LLEEAAFAWFSQNIAFNEAVLFAISFSQNGNYLSKQADFMGISLPELLFTTNLTISKKLIPRSTTHSGIYCL